MAEYGFLGWFPELMAERRRGQALQGLDLNGDPDEIDKRAKQLLGSGEPENINFALKLLETSRRAREQQLNVNREKNFNTMFGKFMSGKDTGEEPELPAPQVAPPIGAPAAAPRPGAGMIAPVDVDEVSGQSRQPTAPAAPAAVPQAPAAPRAPSGLDRRIMQGEALLANAQTPGQRAAISSMLQGMRQQQQEGRAEARDIRKENRAIARESEKDQRELEQQVEAERRKSEIRTQEATAGEKRRSELSVGEKEAEHLFKAHDEIFKDARAASAERGTIQAARQALEDPLFYSGMGAGVVGRVGRFMAPLYKLGLAAGVDKDNPIMKDMRNSVQASDLQSTFEALGKKLTLDNLGGKLGGQISDSDRNFVSSIYTSLDNTITGNRARLIILDKFAERKEKIAELAREYKGRSRRELEEIIANYNKTNPIFSESEQNAIRQSTGITEAKAAAAQPKGYKILGVE